MSAPGHPYTLHAPSQAAVEMQQRVELVLRRAALGGARYGAALFVLGAGLLSGRRGTTSALVAALLWLGCVVGELRVMSQVGRGGEGVAGSGL